MATDRVGIEIDIMGYDEAMSQMKSLERSMKGLSGRKNYLKVKAQVEELKLSRDALKAHKVKLQADTRDVESKIKGIRAKINQLNKAKLKFPGAPKAIQAIENEIGRLEARIEELNTQKIHIGEELGQTQAEINETVSAIQRLEHALRNVKSMSAGQIFKGISSSVAHLGSAMQSAGNSLTKLTTPFRSLMRSTVFAGGFALFNTISKGLSDSFERADILQTYIPIMRNLGVAEKKAGTALNDLNESVLGLPTSLQEIVEQHKLLTMAMGDVDKATKLAIASNNAWIASGADEGRVTMAKKELNTLAQTGKLNERQWMTLQKGMAVTWNELEKHFKKTEGMSGSLLENLKDGTISAEKFMDALSDEGLSGTTKEIVGEMKHTFSSAFSNIQLAFTRMFERIFGGEVFGEEGALNQVLKQRTGKDVIDYLLELRDGINAASVGIQNWIKANPDLFLNFIDTLKSFDWKGLGEGVGNGLKTVGKVFTWFAGLFNGRFINAKNLGRLMSYGSLLGTLSTMVGGLLKGTRHIIGGGGAVLVSLGRWMGNLFSFFAGGEIAGSLGKVGAWVKGFLKIKGATDAAESAVKAASKKSVSLKNHFKVLARSLSSVAAAGGMVLTIGGTVLLSVKMIKSIVKDLGTISSDARKVDPNAMKKLGKWVSIIGGTFASLGAIVGGTGVGLKVAGYLEAGLLAIGTLVTTISGFAWINSGLIKGTVKNLADTVDSVYDIIDGVNKLSGKKLKTKGLAKAADAIGTVFSEFDELKYTDEDGNEIEINPRKAKKLKKLYKAIEGVTESVKKTAEDLKAIAEVGDIDSAKENAQKVLEGMGEVYGSVAETFDLTTKKDIKGSKRGDKVTSNVSAIIANIAGSIGDFKLLAKLKVDLDKAKENADQIAGKMKEIYESLLRIFTEPENGGGSWGDGPTPDRSGGASGLWNRFKAGLFGEQGVETDTTAGIAGNVSKIVGEITKTIGQLREAYDALAGEKGLKDVDDSALETTAESARSIIHQLGFLYHQLNYNLGEADMGNIPEQLDGLLESVKTIGKVAAKLKSLGEGDLADGGAAVAPAVESIKKMISDIGNAIDTTAIEGIREKTENLKSSIDEIFSSLNDSVSDVEVEVKISGTVSGDKELINKINDADASISRAVADIDRDYYVPVTVTISPSLNKLPMPSVDYPHTGGYIGGNGKLQYRAKGGGIGNLFKPKGTDTVPAMLTPGEYVMKRQAVDSFGVRFMQRINNLDIAGAMRELSAKAGITSAAARSTVVYNNNVTNNNNPTINQNINTNNPNFAFKRSNRYVMAL